MDIHRAATWGPGGVFVFSTCLTCISPLKIIPFEKSSGIFQSTLNALFDEHINIIKEVLSQCNAKTAQQEIVSF